MAKTREKTKYIMVQGTMSGVGKSVITAGLCRVFAQEGYRVAPFKSQNMALNSFVTEEGFEMGRAQVMQAEAAGTKPLVAMNPILLKPVSDTGSQVIVNGKVYKNMSAKDYFNHKETLIPHILSAVHKLEENYDIIVIEGAGSPAEINLKQHDIVNMGMAALVDAPVLLVGDIDRGGVFAQLLGTLELLEPEEKRRVKGLIVNKFRGDKTILDPGLAMLEEKGGVPVAGVLPYADLILDEEDSLTERFEKRTAGDIDIAVIKLPHISNFTDFMVFDTIPGVSLRYVKHARSLGNPDLIIIPGTKSTIGDMRWLHESGLSTAILRHASKNTPVFGICGGYQMLGETISDPDGAETGGSIRGLALLPVHTVLKAEKTRKQVTGTFEGAEGIFSALTGLTYTGYEIHMGETLPVEGAQLLPFTAQGSGYCKGQIYGSYIHGIFDAGKVAESVISAIASAKGTNTDVQAPTDYAAFKESQYNALADMIRANTDMELIRQILELSEGK